MEEVSCQWDEGEGTVEAVATSVENFDGLIFKNFFEIFRNFLKFSLKFTSLDHSFPLLIRTERMYIYEEELNIMHSCMYMNCIIIKLHKSSPVLALLPSLFAHFYLIESSFFMISYMHVYMVEGRKKSEIFIYILSSYSRRYRKKCE